MDCLGKELFTFLETSAPIRERLWNCNNFIQNNFNFRVIKNFDLKCASCALAGNVDLLKNLIEKFLPKRLKGSNLGLELDKMFKFKGMFSLPNTKSSYL